jgi:acetyltransferase-like isoleucine patch superfamily enzyme
MIYNTQIINRLRSFKSLILKNVSTLYVTLVAPIYGVKMGRKNIFFGLPYFHKQALSTIKIGNSCSFRSDSNSNLIGVNHKCIISTHSNNAIIEIKDNSGFSGVTIGAAKKIVIGNNVLCGANAVITDFDWHSSRLDSPPSEIIIHDNEWLGLNVLVLKGVEIGENSIIGANSVVTNNIPANVIAAGNPCKVIKGR